MAEVHEREKTLEQEVVRTVETALPGVEVLALELTAPEHFTVFIDHPQGVDHALCARVTETLRGYLDRYAIDVSSPGLARPLRKRAHFANVVGRKVAVRTAAEIEGRKRFRGELVEAREREFTVRTADDTAFTIPYDAIVRSNLIDEG
jgi:ribosome maturation factor RimP